MDICSLNVSRLCQMYRRYDVHSVSVVTVNSTIVTGVIVQEASNGSSVFGLLDLSIRKSTSDCTIRFMCVCTFKPLKLLPYLATTMAPVRSTPNKLNKLQSVC